MKMMMTEKESVNLMAVHCSKNNWITFFKWNLKFFVIIKIK